MPTAIRTIAALAIALAMLVAPSTAGAATGALQLEDQCVTPALHASDDGSSAPLALGFTMRFG